jgi:hypothetical protein
MFPLYIKNTVGMLLIFKPVDNCGKLSIFSLTILTFPSKLRTISLRTGSNFLHGAHQSA